MSKKISNFILCFCMIATMLIPTGISILKAEDKEEVITTIDDAMLGTGLNQFEFSAGWKAASGVGVDYNGTEHWTNKTTWGANTPKVTIRFDGNKLEVFGKKDKDLGIYKVVVDNEESTSFEVDAYNLSPQYQEKLFDIKGLEEKEHIVEIYIQDKINPMASATNIGAQIDYAKAYSMQPIDPNKLYETYINDHTIGNGMFQFNFSDGWSTSSGYPDQFYNGDEHWTTGNGATDTFEPSFTLKFYGSKIELYGKKESIGAIYSIRIDEGAEEEVDSYSAAAQTKQLIYSKDNLEEKEHTLYFKVLHKKNPGNTSVRYSAEVDYAVATHKAIPATDIEVDKDSLTVEAGMNEKIKAVATPSYATNASITYSVDDESIATISDTGEVTGVKAGAATIKVAIKGKNIEKIIPLTVTPEGYPLVISMGDQNRLETQEDYDAIAKSENASFQSSAWLGDIINSKINMVTKGKDVHNAKIKVSDFTNGNNVIKASNVETYWIKETKANIGRGNAGAPVKDFPDILHTQKIIDISSKKVQSAWININVPKDAAPGVYSGKVSIVADELDKPYELSYTFEVINLVQPTTDDTDMSIQIWQHPFAVAEYYGVKKEDYFKEAHLKYLRESMREYKEMGGRDVVANIVEEAWNHQSYTSDPTMVGWTKKSDGTFTFDYTLFDRWIQFNVDEGVLDPEAGLGQIKCYSIVPWGNQVTYYDEASGSIKKESPATGTDQWKALWQPFLSDFIQHVEKKGWFDITYIAMDERGIGDLKNAVSLIETVENSTGESFKISSAMNYQSANDFAFTDKIDDVSIGLSHISTTNTIFKDLAAHRSEKGLVTTVYTCTGDYPSNYTISDPADNTWTIWYAMSQGATGYMRWAWDNWVIDPLTNVTYKYWEPGDGWFIYPTEKGQTSEDYYYKTPRYEMFKQGIRDVNKAKYLTQQSNTLNTEVDTLVKSLKRPVQGGNGYGSAVASSEADRELVFSEVSRMREEVMKISKEYASSLVIPVTSIDVNKTTITLTEGDSIEVKASVKPTNATNKTLHWTSDNTKVANVKNGEITGITKGKAVITVTDSTGTVKKDIQVTVIEKGNINAGDITNVSLLILILLISGGFVFFQSRKKENK